MEHILNLFSLEQFKKGIRRFEIAYKTEARVGDELSFYIQEGEHGEKDVEVKKADGSVVCQARIIFCEEKE